MNLKIHSALYGYRGYMRDVTNEIDSRRQGNKITLPVINENLGGDWYPGKTKELWLLYTLNGISKFIIVSEGEILTIPKFEIVQKITQIRLWPLALIIFIFFLRLKRHA